MEEKEFLIENIKKWIKIDNEIKQLSSELNKRKKIKKELNTTLIEVMKRFSAEQQPEFWREVFSLGYARGGNLNLFGNDIDAVVTKSKGKVTGIRIGDIPYTIDDLREEGFSNSFINILIAAGEANEFRGQSQ